MIIGSFERHPDRRRANAWSLLRSESRRLRAPAGLRTQRCRKCVARQLQRTKSRKRAVRACLPALRACRQRCYARVLRARRAGFRDASPAFLMATGTVQPRAHPDLAGTSRAKYIWRWLKGEYY